VPYYESASEEAERQVQERIDSLAVLRDRSVLLREVRRELAAIHGLVKNSKRKQALDKLQDLQSRIGL
jgi:hypothetical protein